MGLRTLIAEDGTEWTVWNIAPASSSRAQLYSVQLAGGWLCFECPTEKRRLAPPPQGWEDISDAELEECLGRAEQVVRRGDVET